MDDPLLKQIIWWANGIGDDENPTTINVRITVVVQGLLISGTVISVKEYYELTGQWLEDSVPAEQARLGAKLHEVFSSAIDRFEWVRKGDRRERRQGGVGDTSDVRGAVEGLSDLFLSLKDAVAWPGSGPRPVNLSLWQGRLETIGGWSLGPAVPEAIEIPPVRF